MNSKYKKANELTENDLKQLYSIHKKVYYNKGIGLHFNTWKYNLVGKDYHGVTTKNIQLFHLYENTRIDAYNIFTEPIKINGIYWSKIIEGGSAPFSPRDSKSAFLKMYKDLFLWRENTIFMGETGVKFPAVTNLLIESGFKKDYSMEKIKMAIKVLIQSNDFLLFNGDDGIEIKRRTALIDAYHGFVLVKNNNI